MIFLLFSLFILIVSIIVSRGMKWYENFLIPFWKPNGYLVGEFFGLIFVSSFLSLVIALSSIIGVFFSTFVYVFYSILGLVFIFLNVSFFALKKMILSILISFIGILFFIGSVFIFNTYSSYIFILLLPLFVWFCFAIYLSYSIYKFDIDQKESQ